MKKKILIVEDDAYVSRMYERAFKVRGYEVEVSGDGQLAMDTLHSATDLPSVIALDLILPKMSGADVLTEIKKDQRLKDIPVAILTNSLNTEESKKYLSMGADLYLIKFDNSSAEIIDKIDALLASRTSGGKAS